MLQHHQDEHVTVSEQLAEKAPWTLKQTIAGMVLTLVPWFLLNIASSLSSSGAPTTQTPLSPGTDLANAIATFIVTGFIQSIFLLVPIYFAFFRTRPTEVPRREWGTQALGFRRFQPRVILTVIGLLVLIYIINVLYQLFLQAMHLDLKTNDQVILSLGKRAPITFYVTLFLSVFVAPVCEEVFFRGFVFSGLRRGMPVFWAILLSAIIFALTHFDPASFLVLLCLGIAFAYLRWRTGSIWPGICLHWLNNTLGTVLILVNLYGHLSL
uniref:CAAX prenyl protease 2/Lysostaphin resistance protein A-like domain-containing protein n=1 Tax=Thermosporothrix sp. COM3 TaxID=2490863 RepID=A0A455SLI2_9CHLR|nr:hypothetical protein KTC_32210 [Thermosporothrix sp. COM3]